MGVERMLRIYFLQQWFNLSDPAVEEALYDSLAMRSFVGIDLGREPVPDETTVCKFRHLLEKHEIGAAALRAGATCIWRSRASKSPRARSWMRRSSTPRVRPRTQRQERDPDMHQTKKGKQWYFGMKAHIGVDSKTKVIHAVVATAANVADSTILPDLLHGEETRVWGDQAYKGQTEVIREHAPKALDFTNRRYRFKKRIDEVQRAKNRTKSKVRSRVEHVFGVIKRRVRLREGALSRPRQERQSPVCHLRARQSVHGQIAFDATRGVVSDSATDGATKRGAKPQSKQRYRANPTRSVAANLHWRKRVRVSVVQTFLNAKNVVDPFICYLFRRSLAKRADI